MKIIINERNSGGKFGVAGVEVGYENISSAANLNDGLEKKILQIIKKQIPEHIYIILKILQK